MKVERKQIRARYRKEHGPKWFDSPDVKAAYRLELTLPTKVERVLVKHRTKHFMNGGNGVSCYVWVNHQLVSSEHSLDLYGEIGAELRAVPGVTECHINID